MKTLKKILIMIILTLLCVILIDNHQYKKQVEKLEQKEQKEKPVISGENPTDDGDNQEEKSNYVTLLALGQIYMNDSVISSGAQEDGSRNYDFLFSGVSDYINSADITVMCQGSVIGGNDLGISGYPTFNSPEEFAGAVVRAGVDAVAMANIRINSMGSSAIANCRQIWRQQSETLKILGIHESAQDTEIAIIEKNGLKISLLNYTAVVQNALTDEESGMVSFLGNYANGQADLSDLSEKTRAELDMAGKTSDFVVVIVSWGLDDTYEITAAQKRYANLLTEAGADLIIGNRPNQMQKVEWITAENGNRALCYYSLGNFVTSEHTAGSVVGGMAQVGIKVENGLTVIDEENIGIVPVVVYYTGDGNSAEVKVSGAVPFAQYTDEMANNHGIHTKYGIDLSRDVVQGILSANIDEIFLK